MKKKIKGGFIRFAIMDKEYTHNFSDHDKLGWLEHYVYIGRPETGMKDFIRLKYVQADLRKKLVANDQIKILSYEFDYSLL
jgi:hypothetical protein